MLYVKLHIPAYTMTKPEYWPCREVPGFPNYPLDTNMHMPECLPAPQEFHIKSIHTIYERPDHDVVEEFRSRYILELHILQKIYFQAPLSSVHSGLRLIEKPKPGMMPMPGYFPDDFPLSIWEHMHYSIRLVGKPFLIPIMTKGINLLIVLNGMMSFGIY